MNFHNEIIILIAEDDDGHAELIQEYLRETGIDNEIIRFVNGAVAWEFLSKIEKGEKGYKNKEYLLLLDIRMPLMDGVEVLRKIKESSVLKSLPVIMLTTTDDPREIEECYKIGCNIYITKPINFKDFTAALKSLGLFIKIVRVAKI